MSTNPTGMRQRSYKERGETSQPPQSGHRLPLGIRVTKKFRRQRRILRRGQRGPLSYQVWQKLGTGQATWGRSSSQGLSVRQSLAVTTLMTIFVGRNERERDVRCSAAAGAGVAEGVCGITEVALRVTMTVAACWLLVGVKVTSAHVRFLKVCLFLSCFVFLQWPRGAERLNISSYQDTQMKNMTERIEMLSSFLGRPAVCNFFFKVMNTFPGLSFILFATVCHGSL